MITRQIDDLTIEFPVALNSYNTPYKLEVTNNGNNDVKIKLELKPLSTEQIKKSWYKIEPKLINVRGGGEKEVLILTITDKPIINNSFRESIEEVKLMMVQNTRKQREKEDLVYTYSLIIPPESQPEKPIISLINLSAKVADLESLKREVENLRNEVQQEKLNAGQHRSSPQAEIQAQIDEKIKKALQDLHSKISNLEKENDSLKQQLKTKADLSALERQLKTKADLSALERQLKAKADLSALEQTKNELNSTQDRLHVHIHSHQQYQDPYQDPYQDQGENSWWGEFETDPSYY